MYTLKKGCKRNNKSAISPVIATVILIAITLIAAIAIGGFVFGLFGSFTNTAQVSATGYSLSASTLNKLTSNPFSYACFNSTNVPKSSYIALSDTGTGSTSVTGVTLVLPTSSGAQSFSMTYAKTTSAESSCSIPGSSTIYLQIQGLGSKATDITAGQFSGTVTLANGGEVPLSGTVSA